MSAIELSLLAAGYCVHPEHVVLRTGRLRPMRFPATFALLQHPERGPILFDTGYAEAFFSATRRSPERLYRWVTPVTADEGSFATQQLRARGIEPEHVETIVISHFHGDHVAGLRDFPRARFVHLAPAWHSVRQLGRLAALRRGHLPDLIPSDFVERSVGLSDDGLRVLSREYAPFQRGWDLFGDGTLVAVPLPGHARGQLGLFVRTNRGETVFLCADAAWTSRSIRDSLMPHQVARLLFDDWRAYRATLEDLRRLQQTQPSFRIVPAHCEEALASFGVRFVAESRTFRG